MSEPNPETNIPVTTPSMAFLRGQPRLKKIHEFSHMTKYPMTPWQLNFLQGNRQIGKTIARVMETLSYIYEAPNMINWGGTTKIMISENQDFLTLKRGWQDWDKWHPIMKERHMPDLVHVDYIYTFGRNHFDRMFSTFQDIIMSLPENNGKKTINDCTFNKNTIIFKKTNKEIIFNSNNHILRFRGLPTNRRNEMLQQNWITDLVERTVNQRGMPIAHAAFTDLDINL